MNTFRIFKIVALLLFSSFSVGQTYSDGSSGKLPEIEEVRGFFYEFFDQYMRVLSKKNDIDDLQEYCSEKGFLKLQKFLKNEIRIKNYGNDYKPLSYEVGEIDRLQIKTYFAEEPLLQDEVSVKVYFLRRLKVQSSYLSEKTKRKESQVRNEGIGSDFNFLLKRSKGTYIIQNFFEEDEIYVHDKYILSHPEEFTNSERKDAEIRVKKNFIYNRTKALIYAKKYWDNYNPDYYNYNSKGGDCTNFGSQILEHGGKPFVKVGGQDYEQWYTKKPKGWSSPSWIKANGLMRHLLDNGYGIEVSNSNRLEAGDFVFADLKNKGRIHHTFIVRSKRDTVLTAHYRNVYDLRLNEVKAKYPEAKFVYVHVIDWVPMPFQTRSYGSDFLAVNRIYSNGSLSNENTEYFDPRVFYAISHNNFFWKRTLKKYIDTPITDGVPTSLWRHFANPGLWRPNHFYEIVFGNKDQPDKVMFDLSFKKYESEVKRYLARGGSLSCAKKASKVNRNWLLFTCDYQEAGDDDPPTPPIPEEPDDPNDPEQPIFAKVKVKYCMREKSEGPVKISITMNGKPFKIDPSRIVDCGGNNWSEATHELELLSTNFIEVIPKGGTGYPFKVREIVERLNEKGKPVKKLRSTTFRILKNSGNKTKFKVR